MALTPMKMLEDFGIGEREGQKDGVARGHVGDGDAAGHLGFVAIFGDGDVGGEGGTAEGSEVKTGDAMFDCAELFGDFGGSFHFYLMALAVIEREAVRGEALLTGDGQAGG